ncbi:MAG: DUF4340 domain-containing protein [Bryobacteraceae bacterium]
MKRLLIAALVLAGLGGAIWYSEKQEAAKTAQPDTKAPPKILALKEEDVKQIDLERAGEAPTVMVKDDSGKWTMTSPALPADVIAIASLSGLAASIPSDHVVDDNLTDLPAYGLDPAVVSLKLTMKDGKVNHLRIGGETPDKSSVYASVDGDKHLYAMSSQNRDTFNKSARDLREKHLLSFDPAQLSRVELDVVGKPPLEFSKAGDSWQILKPRPLRADGLQVDELVRQLKEAEMDISADDKQAATAFASGKPHSTARVTTPAGALSLEVRKSGDDYYAHSSALPGAFKVTPALGTAVNKTLDDFQNKKLFDFAFDEPSKVHYKSKDDDKTFEKAGTNWLSNGRTVDSVGVQSVIDKLRELSAKSVDDVKPATSEIEITVVSKEGKQTEVVTFAKTATDYLARRGTEPGTYHVAPDVMETLRQAVTGVQEAAPPAKDAKKK